MSGDCQFCFHWCKERRRVYDDGSHVVTYQAPAGLGLCEVLETETRPEFGCRSFEETDSDHIAVETISGAPWQHFTMIQCPDCNNGINGGVCGRCQGTQLVRLYDDGYIGEEKTRRHPMECDAPLIVDPGTILAPQPKASVL